MRVLMLGWELPPAISGGLGTACKGIAENLAEKGVELLFVLPSENRGKPDITDKIKVIYANRLIDRKNISACSADAENYSAFTMGPCESVISPYYSFRAAGSEFLLPGREKSREKTFPEMLDGKYSDSIIRLTGNYGKNLYEEVLCYSLAGKVIGKTEEFDIIHAHDWITWPAAISAKKASGKPLVVHVQATEYDRSWASPVKGILQIEKKGMDFADKIIAVSHYTKNMIVNKYSIDPGKIEVVHNAVDKKTQSGRYQIRKNFQEKIVLFLGRITSQKGPSYFVEAALKVLNKNNKVRFVMSGNGDMLPGMINRIAELDIAENFHFTGFLKDSEVEKIYAMSDLYVMPSVSEPFGLTPFEALLYDVPVIISGRSGAAEILAHAPTVDFADTGKLAKTIIELLENEELREKTVRLCREEMKALSWSSAADKIAGIYKKLA